MHDNNSYGDDLTFEKIYTTTDLVTFKNSKDNLLLNLTRLVFANALIAKKLTAYQQIALSFKLQQTSLSRDELVAIMDKLILEECIDKSDLKQIQQVEVINLSSDSIQESYDASDIKVIKTKDNDIKFIIISDDDSDNDHDVTNPQMNKAMSTTSPTTSPPSPASPTTSPPTSPTTPKSPVTSDESSADEKDSTESSNKVGSNNKTVREILRGTKIPKISSNGAKGGADSSNPTNMNNKLSEKSTDPGKLSTKKVGKDKTADENKKKKNKDNNKKKKKNNNKNKKKLTEEQENQEFDDEEDTARRELVKSYNSYKIELYAKMEHVIANSIHVDDIMASLPAGTSIVSGIKLFNTDVSVQNSTTTSFASMYQAFDTEINVIDRVCQAVKLHNDIQKKGKQVNWAMHIQNDVLASLARTHYTDVVDCAKQTLAILGTEDDVNDPLATMVKTSSSDNAREKLEQVIACEKGDELANVLTGKGSTALVYASNIRLLAYVIPCICLTDFKLDELREQIKLFFSIVCNDPILYNVYCCRVPNHDKEYLATFLNCHEVVYRYVAKYCSNVLKADVNISQNVLKSYLDDHIPRVIPSALQRYYDNNVVSISSLPIPRLLTTSKNNPTFKPYNTSCFDSKSKSYHMAKFYLHDLLNLHPTNQVTNYQIFNYTKNVVKLLRPSERKTFFSRLKDFLEQNTYIQGQNKTSLQKYHDDNVKSHVTFNIPEIEYSSSFDDSSNPPKKKKKAEKRKKSDIDSVESPKKKRKKVETRTKVTDSDESESESSPKLSVEL